MRIVCWIRGHRWSDWHAGGYLIPHREGHDDRLCWRCGQPDYRPTTGAA